VPDAAGAKEPVEFFPWEQTDLVGDLRSAVGA